MKTRVLSLFASLTLLGVLAWGGTLRAQDTTPTPPTTPPTDQPQTQQPPAPTTPDTQQPTSQTPDPSATPGAANAADVQEFSGTVTKVGDKYVLKDDAGKTYDIDHQDEVKKFDGKRVRVKGTLDPTGQKIMVR